MANNFDRQATKGLYGLAQTKTVWSKPPTTINPPANGPRPSAPSSTNSHNPFNVMGRKPRHTGNATSESTLLGRAPIHGPPSKKRKVDDPTFTTVHHSRIRKADRLALAPDPEPTIVDLESEDVASDDLNIRPSLDATSEHETRLSKYYVKQPSSYRGYTVAQDGEEFKEMKARFSNSIDPDPIEEFTPDDCPIGFVKGRVADYEGGGPKVDFTKVTTKSKMKGKISTSGFGLVGTPAQSSNTRNDDTYDSIPVECLYKDQELVKSTPPGKIKMYATPNGTLFLKLNNKTLFAFPINSREKSTMIHPNSGIKDSPVIQFKTQGSSTNLITIRLDIKDSDWDQMKYVRFTKSLEKVGVKLESTRNTNVLWQVAGNHAGALTKETGGGKHNSRLSESYQALNRNREVQEIHGRRKERSLGPPPSASSRDSLSTNLGRGGPDLDLNTSRCASPLNLQFESSVSLSEIGPAPSPKSEFRVTRSRTKAESNEHTIENPEEVILSYPAGLPGAVNITNADVDRLAPGNFLNDTLIEFSLKLWLKDLEASNPELAHQIHVFNSFFYKKLNVRKDSQVAYESIRKWTSKIDIFKKKYIIVPINEHMHWYLAIIYEPEHILKASPADGNLPRPHTRQSTSLAALASNPTSELGQREGSLETYTETQDLHSEAEIERSLNDFGSCSIASPDTIMKSPLKLDNHNDIYGDEPMSDVDMDFDESANVTPDLLRLSPTVSDYGKNVQHHRSCSIDSMAVGESGKAAGPSVALQNKPVKMDGEIDATSFYQPAGVRKQYKGKKRAKNGSDSPEIKVDSEEEGGVIVVDDIPKTYIFTFDSLGGRHPQAMKKLSAYLKMEAKDKKGIDNAGTAEGKMALVPCQPNFCDCGIYLLHFAQTFMSDATRYATTILTSRPKAVTSEERSRVWCENEIQGSKGRNKLRLRIEDLSSEWKKLRIGTKEQKPLDDVKKEQSEESEGEVELVESDSGRKVVSNRARKAGPAVRVRG